MNRTRPVLRIAVVMVVVLAAAVLSGCLPEQIELGIMPMTVKSFAANANRGGFDVFDGQASWVEADASGKGPIKYVDRDDVVSTVETQALAAWTAIGGSYGTAAGPLVAYRTDESGVHIVDPRTSVETTFVAGVVPLDFGGVWLVYQETVEGTISLQAIDVKSGAIKECDSGRGVTFSDVRVNQDTVSWFDGTSVKVRRDNVLTTVPVMGTGVTVERVFSANGTVSWTERNSSGYRRIYLRPSGSLETTEVLPGGPSKEMGGFDGDYITWFEGYGTPSATARAVAYTYNLVNKPGDQLTYTDYDPSRFAWDFDALLWQKRGTDALYLTRFRAKPPRVKGGDRVETLANLAMARGGVSMNQAVVASPAMITPRAAGAGVEIARDEPLVMDVIVTAGYRNASPDAIVAPGLCGVYGGPMLLVDHKSIPAPTARAIVALRDAAGGGIRIHVIGGTSAISKKVYEQLSALKGTGTIDRIGGRDRYDTAAKVAATMKAVLASRGETMGPQVMLLNGSDARSWDFAASTGAVSETKHIPVLFTRRLSVPRYTKTALTKLGLSERYIIGPQANVSDYVRRVLKVAKADRVAGATKYSTSLAVANWGVAKGWLNPRSVTVAGHLHEALAASGYSFSVVYRSISIAGAPIAPTAAPVVLSPPASLDSGLAGYLAQPLGPTGHPEPLLIGGEYSVSTNSVRQMLEIIGDWWRSTI